MPLPPMILLAAGGLALVSGRFLPQRPTIAWGIYFLLALLLSAGSLWVDPLIAVATFNPADVYRVWTNDRLAASMQWLALLFGVLTIMVLIDTPLRWHHQSQTSSFVLFTVAGLMLVARASDFLSLGMSLEIVSLAVVAFQKCRDLPSNPVTNSAPVSPERYSDRSVLWFDRLISGLFWFGIALLVHAVATTQFDAIRTILSETYHDQESRALTGTASKMILLAAGLIVISLIGRMGIVPFHLSLVETTRERTTLPWGFTVIAGQLAGSIALSRLCGRLFVGLGYPTIVLLTVVSLATFLMSGVIAVRGFSPGLKSIPRWLTSMVLLQCGWLVCGIMIAAAELEYPDVRWGAFPHQNETLSGFVFSQCASVLALWGIMGVLDDLSRSDRGIEFLEELKGLWQVAPVASVALLVSLASAIGVPMTAGFWGRWLTLLAGSNVHVKASSTMFEPHAGIRAVILAGTVATVFVAGAVIRISREMILESPLSRVRVDRRHGPLTAGRVAAIGCLLLGVIPQLILFPMRKMETPIVPRIKEPVKGSGKNPSVFRFNMDGLSDGLAFTCQARSARQVQRQFVNSTKLACFPWQASTCWAQFCPVWSGTSLPDHQPREDNPFILVDPDS